MKKFISVLAASSLALTVASTSFAKEAAPGQQCSGLFGMAKQRCMRSVLMGKMSEKELGTSGMKRAFSRRQIKENERTRQHLGINVNKTKTIFKENYYVKSSSSSSTSSSAGTSSSASSSSTSSSTSSQQ